MQQALLRDDDPVCTLELEKSKTRHADMDALLAALKARVDAHPAAAYIATLDHESNPGGRAGQNVAADYVASKLMVFSSEVDMPNPGVLVVRPRTVGVTEFADRFVINFVVAPASVGTDPMEDWVRALRDE